MAETIKKIPDELVMKTEFFQPWSTFVMKTRLPPEVLEKMIQITDKIVEADDPATRHGDYLASQIKNEFDINLDIIEREYLMGFFNEVCKYFIVKQYCQSQPFEVEKWENEEWLVKLSGMWTVSQRDNEYNVIHQHMNGSISAVMYLKIPEYLPSRKKSVMRPHVGAEKNINNDDGAIVFTGSVDKSSVWGYPWMFYQPQVGDFLIFPSSQCHHVYPFRTADGKGERRSVSFNAMFSSRSEQEEMKKEMDKKYPKGLPEGYEVTISDDQNAPLRSSLNPDPNNMVWHRTEK